MFVTNRVLFSLLGNTVIDLVETGALVLLFTRLLFRAAKRPHMQLARGHDDVVDCDGTRHQRALLHPREVLEGLVLDMISASDSCPALAVSEVLARQVERCGGLDGGLPVEHR